MDTENLLVEAVDAIIAQAGEDETLTKLLIDFTMEKTDDDKSWDISREILETGRLVLNENNRNEITHFQDKSIAEFVEIKMKLSEACTILEKESIVFAEEALSLIDKNGIDTKSFSAGHFPKHLLSIQEGKFNPKNKTYHEFDDKFLQSDFEKHYSFVIVEYGKQRISQDSGRTKRAFYLRI